uniref:Uncharacterized protein n=1 Tax=Lepeophtheirus salmonis TaxID=72036 RepID=A0A0K2UD61_LEPSM
MPPSNLNDGFDTGTNRSTSGLDEVRGQVVPLLSDHSVQGIDIRVRNLVFLVLRDTQKKVSP